MRKRVCPVVKKKVKMAPHELRNHTTGNKGTVPPTRNIGARWKLRGQLHAHFPLPRRKEALYQTELRGWAGPRPGLDVLEIS
jgi:hypothetical protein